MLFENVYTKSTFEECLFNQPLSKIVEVEGGCKFRNCTEARIAKSYRAHLIRFTFDALLPNSLPLPVLSV